MSPPERILLIQMHHLGDVLLTTPSIRAARNAFPKARVDFLTGPLGAQALDGNPHLDHILVMPALRRIFRTHYDAVIDMHSVPRTALYVAASRARLRAGFRGRGPRNLAYTRLFYREDGPVYMARRKMRLLETLGLDVAAQNSALEIAITAPQRDWARQALGAVTTPFIAISPVARHDFKQWGAARWAAVADALAERGMSILITSGPGEQEQARSMAEAMKHPALWQYGPTSVRELAALYAACRLWLGNDGGPKHVAVAAGAPTVTVNRRRLGLVWSDETDPRQIAIDSGSDSLDDVSTQQVIDAALRLL